VEFLVDMDDLDRWIPLLDLVHELVEDEALPDPALTGQDLDKALANERADPLKVVEASDEKRQGIPVNHGL